MRNPKARLTWSVCLAVVLLAASPAESFALCDWLCSWLRPRGTAVTTYTPPFTPRTVVAAPAPATTVCSYVPQTAYQAVYRPVPITAYQPVTTWDPCTGCATTAYRPVTAWGYQTQLVPTTTYRMVCSTPAAVYAPPVASYGSWAAPAWSSSIATGGCGTCAPATGVPSLSPVPSPLSTGTPVTTPGPIPSSTPPAGSPSATGGAPSSVQPAAPGSTGASGSAAGTSGGTPAAGTPSGTTPTYAPPPGSTTPPTGPVSPSAPGRSSGLFESPGYRLRVAPGTTSPSSTPMSPPARGAPGRTAMRTVILASYTQPPEGRASPPARSPGSGPWLDVGGWQPIR